MRTPTPGYVSSMAVEAAVVLSRLVLEQPHRLAKQRRTGEVTAGLGVVDALDQDTAEAPHARRPRSGAETLAGDRRTVTLLLRMRERLEKLRDAFERRFGPESLRRFGDRVPGMITSERTRIQPPLDADGIARIERAHGVTLPDELAAFLTTIHGGGPGPGEGLVIPDRPRSRTARPFPYGAAEIARGAGPLPLVDEDTDDDWPPGPGFIELAHLGCGVFDVIVVTGEQRGQMWCCDMAWRPHGDGFLRWYERWLGG
jgi:SMI1/KNR4 family protein SUKH-1